jgi:hypothetical protein
MGQSIAKTHVSCYHLADAQRDVVRGWHTPPRPNAVLKKRRFSAMDVTGITRPQSQARVLSLVLDWAPPEVLADCLGLLDQAGIPRERSF